MKVQASHRMWMFVIGLASTWFLANIAGLFVHSFDPTFARRSAVAPSAVIVVALMAVLRRRFCHVFWTLLGFLAPSQMVLGVFALIGYLMPGISKHRLSIALDTATIPALIAGYFAGRQMHRLFIAGKLPGSAPDEAAPRPDQPAP